MLSVAPIWRVSVLMIPLAVMVGCDWIPVRRRVDPALYPVPNRPDPDLIRGRRAVLTPASVKAAGPGKDAAPATAEPRQLPPLPELVRVAPEEILRQSVPTPLLDSAIERAEAIQSTLREGTDGEDGGVAALLHPVVGPTLPLDIDLEPIAESDLVGEEEPLAPEPVDLPPIPDEPDAGSEVDLDANEQGTNRPSDDASSDPSDDESVSDEDEATSASDLLDEALPAFSGEPAVASVGDMPAGIEPLPLNAGPWTLDGPTDEATRWQVMMELLAGSGGETSDPDEPPGPALRISRTEFCREILGFDRIDPIAPRSIEAGQRTLIYCEVEGVAYVLEQDAFSSQLETTLEIVPGDQAVSSESALWREFVTFEDRCSRPRHDYFVGYLLTIPGTISPGPHLLRVTQRDPRSGIEAVADLPFEVVAPAPPPVARFR